MLMKMFCAVLSVLMPMLQTEVVVNKVEYRPDEDWVTITITQQDGQIFTKEFLAIEFNYAVEENQILKTKTSIGEFIAYDEEYKSAVFKSYDDEIRWVLPYWEIGFKPDLFTPYAITYYENGTTTCEHSDCDNCWREDDIFLHIQSFKVDVE